MFTRPLKIAQVSSYYHPATGGVAGVVRYLSEELAIRGHHVSVFTSDRNIDGRRIPNLVLRETIGGVLIRRFRSVGHIGYMTYCPGMAAALRAEDFDVIHAHSYRHPNAGVAIKVGETRGTPTVMHEHGSFPDNWPSRSLKTALWALYDSTAGPRVLSKATSIVTLTARGKANFLSLGIDDQKVRIIPNAASTNEVDADILRRVKSEFSLQGKRIVLFIGSLDKRKNPMQLIDAFSSILRSLPIAFLVIAGPDRGMGTKVRKMINDYRMKEHCAVVGQVDSQTKDGLLAVADLVVVPSYREAFSLVIVEAMQHGKPVVATRVTGPIEIVKDGRTGLLVEPNDPEALAAAILRILSDHPLAAAMGLAAKDESRRYRVEAIVDQVEQLYLHMMQGRSNSYSSL